MFSFKICFCKILYINSPDRQLRGLTDGGFIIQFNLCFISKYIFIQSNQKWLLIIWAMTIYLKIFFQLYYYCSRVFYMASPEAVVYRCSAKKLLLKLDTEFTGKHLYRSLFNRVAGLWTWKFIKKRLQHGCFPVNIPKVLGTVFRTLVAVFELCFSIRKEFLKKKVSEENIFYLINVFHVQI